MDNGAEHSEEDLDFTVCIATEVHQGSLLKYLLADDFVELWGENQINKIITAVKARGKADLLSQVLESPTVFRYLSGLDSRERSSHVNDILMEF